jgi:hypothetical protein
MTQMIDWSEFGRCQKWLEDALEYNMTGQTLDDVKAGLATGEYILWPGHKCALVTEHYEARQGKFLNFFLAAGDLDELATMVPRIESWAKDQGVKRITLFGRRGWERTFLRDSGYRPHWVVMTKDI